MRCARQIAIVGQARSYGVFTRGRWCPARQCQLPAPESQPRKMQACPYELRIEQERGKRALQGFIVGVSGFALQMQVAQKNTDQNRKRPGLNLQVGAFWRASYARSKRSRFITLVQAATKSWTNLSLASLLAYTSARARNWAWEPNTRSTRVPLHFTSPVLRSRAS